jgi:hypothetical protein
MLNFTSSQERATRLAVGLSENVQAGKVTHDRLKTVDFQGSNFLLFEYHSKNQNVGEGDSRWIYPEILHAQPNIGDGISPSEAIQFIEFCDSIVHNHSIAD